MKIFRDDKMNAGFVSLCEMLLSLMESFCASLNQKNPKFPKSPSFLISFKQWVAKQSAEVQRIEEEKYEKSGLKEIRNFHKKAFKLLQKDPTNPNYRSLFYSVSQLRIVKESIEQKLNRDNLGELPAVLYFQPVYTSQSFKAEWDIYAGSVVSAKKPASITPDDTWELADFIECYNRLEAESG